MEKRIWSKPEMNEFAFAANEYVAACGDSGTVYKFTCDAGVPSENWWDPQYGYVWIENNGLDGLQTGVDKSSIPLFGDRYTPADSDGMDDYLTATYHPCGETHEASTADKFYEGYYLHTDKWDKKTGSFNLIDLIKVIIWRGADGKNVHCTTNLDIDNWETAKS